MSFQQAEKGCTGVMDETQSIHKSVLVSEVVDGLSLEQGDIVLDGTLGGGGHSAAICKRLGADGVLICLDVDSKALERAKATLKACEARTHLLEYNFRDLDKALDELGVERVNAVLFDLGFSSDQIDGAEGRGLSFKRDEPLRMTLSDNPRGTQFTARDIVNDWDAGHIETILKGYGDERFAKRIAGAIVAEREKQPIETTFDLVQIIEKTVPRWYTHRKIHPATKTFQALRIAVNDEITALEEGLEKGITALKPKGRIAVISFHSLEDRTVKNIFRNKAKEGIGISVTKKPIIPTHEEIKENPRARSAKLRIFEKY